METLVIIYLLKVSICIALSYVFYSILLKRSTHFQANRFFLLFTLLISFAIPFLKITPPKVAEIKDPTPTISDYFYPISEQSEVLQYQFAKPLRHPTPIFQISIGELLFLIYICVSIFFALRFCKQCWTLSKIIGESVREQESKYDVLYHPDIQISSFFHFLFWRKTESKSSELIFLHERTHMYQWHSLDILILEVAKIVLWFNPFVALFKKELTLLHEFIADREVIRTTHNKKSYLQVLLSQSGQPGFRLTHHFNSYITKRLKMLDRKKSHALTHSFYILYVPLLVSMVIAFNPDASNDHLISSSIDKLGDVTSLNAISIQDRAQPENDKLFLEWGKHRLPVSEKLVPFVEKPRNSRIYRVSAIITKEDLGKMLEAKLVFHDHRKDRISLFEPTKFYGIAVSGSDNHGFYLEHKDYHYKRSTSYDHMTSVLRDSFEYVMDESRLMFSIMDEKYPCAIHLTISDPNTRKSYVRHRDKKFTIQQFSWDPDRYPFFGGRRSPNRISFKEMIATLSNNNIEVWIEGTKKTADYHLVYLDDIDKAISPTILIEDLEADKSIARPIGLISKIVDSDEEYISIFDDETPPSIVVQDWSTYFHLPYTIKFMVAEVKESLTLNWGPIVLTSPGPGDVQEELYFGRVFTNAHLKKNDNKVEKSYIKRVLRNDPTLFVNNSEVKDFTVSFRYIDHVGVPFKCSLFYKNGQLAEGAECVKIVRERIKPDDFIEKLTVRANGEVKILGNRIKIK